MGDGRTPLYYTFGNHMHWVDMQWLWGYDVLPGSVRDMLSLIEETGARGNVNFDGISYEKMAAECPEALAQLREAVGRGEVEPVGCSYGQPYGLFHGGESNVRQFAHGVRSVRRLLDVRPRTFWEEEFYFFPQLPQLLRQCGFTGASLFFQWTWHTPEVPKEPHSLILWEGIDGTRIPTLPRSDLNVHQWPEEFDGLLDGPLIHERDERWGPPVIVQWLELIPTRDWMCRSELLLPRLKELIADDRFEVRHRTCSELIEELQQNPQDVPVRKYSMDDVWHGVTLGKNGDQHPRTSRTLESLLLACESLSSTMGMFGRPYAGWDVYPVWELDEAWRELLSAQHHDNHECEGLCGSIGRASFDRCRALAKEVRDRTLQMIARRLGRHRELKRSPSDHVVGVNSLGWSRRVTDSCVLPPFGFASQELLVPEKALENSVVIETDEVYRIERGSLSVDVLRATGEISQIRTIDEPEGLLGADARLLGPGDHEVSEVNVTITEEADRRSGVTVKRGFSSGQTYTYSVSISSVRDAIEIRLSDFSSTNAPEPGLAGSLRLRFHPGWKPERIIADTPFSVQDVGAPVGGVRKYPEGDWMTSPQWFEKVAGPFSSHRIVDLCQEETTGAGLLIAHDGSQQWFKRESHVECVLTAYDPWDENYYSAPGCCSFFILPHGRITNAERVQFGFESDTLVDETFGDAGGDLPPLFGPLEVQDAPNVLAHAFFRESMRSGEHLPDWAGHRMFKESGGACDHPFTVRLVEWDGDEADVALTLAGDVALAAKTNLMGETGDWKMGDAPNDAPPHLQDTGWLVVEQNADPPAWAIVDGRPIEFKGEPVRWSRVRLPMRPREIATIMADMVMGRKEWRNLDAKRKVWATIHNT